MQCKRTALTNVDCNCILRDWFLWPVSRRARTTHGPGSNPMISVWTVEEKDLSWAVMHVRIHHAAELMNGNYRIAIIYILADIAGHLQFFPLPRFA